MPLNKTCAKASVCKYDAIPIQNDLKLGGALSPLFINFSSELVIRKVKSNH